MKLLQRDDITTNWGVNKGLFSGEIDKSHKKYLRGKELPAGI